MRFDLNPLYRSTVGFDRLFQMLDAAAQGPEAPSYPPYNIERLAENDYRITMAVAGFAEADLTIESKEGVLTVSGKRPADEKKTYLHQGIAARSFERRFQLADHVEATGARLENGLLHVDLVRRVPEEKKPRRIAIVANESPSPRTIEGTAAAA